MARYPSYQPTNIPWLPEIPEGWELKKVQYLFTERSEKGYPEETPLCSTQAYGVIPQALYENRVVVTSKDGLASQKLVLVGDFVISLRSFQGGIEMAHYRGVISAAYTILSLKNRGNLAYFRWLFKSHPFIQLLRTCVTGIREGQNINYSMLSKQSLPIPPLAEQERIVSYLDKQTVKIDKLVAAKTKEIALLKELREKTIADAVTRGLPGTHTTFQSTDIHWLPEIPKGWDVKRAKSLFKKEQRSIQANDEIVTAFRDGQVTLRKNRRITGFTEATDYTHYQGIRKGDLVIHQMDAFAGCAGVSDSDGMGTPVLSVCTPLKENIVDVYYYAHVIRLMGHNGYIQSLARGIRERSSDFRFDTFSKQHLPVPPLAEQERIVSYLDKQTAKIDKAVALLASGIEHLKAYRERLIADVVTGQQKVE